MSAHAPPAKEPRAALALSVPGMSCAGCMSKVERGLLAVPGVHQARVNLTLKRALIEAEPHVHPDHLIDALAGVGFQAHEMEASQLAATQNDAEGRALLLRLGVSGFAAMNVMLLSVAVWSGADGATRDLFHWLSAAIALPALAYAGHPFYHKAFAALRARRLNMDVPITLAILLAVVTSLWETALSGRHAYFDAAIALCFFLLAGRYLDHRARAAARGAAAALSALEVRRALRRDGDQWVEVATETLAPGDVVLVRPGARLPADGEVLRGQSQTDRSALTGESLAVTVGPGDRLSSGEVNLTAPLHVRVSAAAKDSSLARMADLVATAESGRANYSPLADRAASLYAPGVHVLALLAGIGWYVATWDARVALNIAAAVLIITCPCALGLAVPAVTTAASGRLFRSGLLIKDGTALERLAEADIAVFDKTGTLTTGLARPEGLAELTPDQRQILRALGEASAHPFAQSMAAELARGDVPVAPLTAIREIAGQGVQADWQGVTVRLGRASFVGSPAQGAGSASYFRVGDGPAHRIGLTDPLRPGAAEMVAALQAQGLRVMLLSGDHAAPVQAVAERLGIARAEAELTPKDKHDRIAALRAQGHSVLMIGDGLNDTAALSAASVSIAPASSLDAARAASDMVLLGQDMRVLSEAVATARLAVRRIRENFALATVYNIVAVPLAMVGLVTPLIAALAMSASSITVSLNALRVRPRLSAAAPSPALVPEAAPTQVA